MTRRTNPYRKRSAAAAKRTATEVVAKRTQPISDAQQAFLDKYKPQRVDLTRWPEVEQPFRAFMATTGGHFPTRGDEVDGAFKNHCTHVAHFALWLAAQGQEVNSQTLTSLTLIDEFTRVGQQGAARHGGDRRSRLRWLAAAVNPDVQLPRPGYTIARTPIKPPYTADEVTAIIAVATVQPRPDVARKLCAIVGLGLGAGCDSTDLKALHVDDIDDRGESGGLIVTIRSRGGERRVAVLRVYEDLVRRGLQGLTAGRLLVGQKKDRGNVVTPILAKAQIHGDVPHIEAGRLRTTWLATLMTRPVPLAVILDAAGLTSARTITDLLPHLPVSDATTLREAVAS